MEQEFWINNCGQNMLKGVEGDALNPIRLPDVWVLDFLLTIPNAKASYIRLYPDLLPEEQARLFHLQNPDALNTILDDTTVSDRFQTSLNKSGVQRGGGWRPPS